MLPLKNPVSPSCFLINVSCQWRGAAVAAHAIATCHCLKALRIDHNPLCDAACAGLVAAVHSREVLGGLDLLDMGRLVVLFY